MSSEYITAPLHKDPQMDLVSVRVGGKVFTTDKALLSRNCEYFRALFRSGMLECQQEEISLQSLCSRSFSVMLAVGRGERPILDDEEIVEAIECAAFLQSETLTLHLLDLLNSDNCLIMCQAAAIFGLASLYERAAQFIRDLRHDLRQELGHLPLELVRYVDSLDASTLVAVGTHPSCNPTELDHAATRTVCYLDEAANDWRILTDLPMQASTSLAGVTVLDNRLYVIGGVQGVHKQAGESCFCYDVAANSWAMLPSPQQLRYNFSLVGARGRLYAIGGEFERTTMSSVEVYDVSSKTWSFAAHLPRPVAGAATAKAMSRIFVCLWKPMDTTDIYEYSPHKDEWGKLTTLVKHQSYGHFMVGHRDNLYVIRNGPKDDFLRCLMDCYNLSTGQWTAMPGYYANSKGALFTSVVKGDSVFTVNRTVTVEYAVAGNTWKLRNQMEGFPRNGSVWTFLLQIPQEKRGAKSSTALNGSSYDEARNQGYE